MHELMTFFQAQHIGCNGLRCVLEVLAASPTKGDENTIPWPMHNRVPARHESMKHEVSREPPQAVTGPRGSSFALYEKCRKGLKPRRLGPLFFFRKGCFEAIQDMGRDDVMVSVNIKSPLAPRGITQHTKELGQLLRVTDGVAIVGQWREVWIAGGMITLGREHTGNAHIRDVMVDPLDT